MDTNSASAVRIKAIAANLAALHSLLTEAAKRSREGHEIIQRGECNGAIGVVLGLDALLDDAKALYVAAVALHRLRTA